jgi:hypothetical protein
MVIFHLTNNNSEQSYTWLGAYERDLPRYDCVYCGSGDYILSAGPNLFIDIVFETPANVEYVVIPSQVTPIEQAIPEPATFALVLVFILTLVACRLLTYVEKQSPKKL